jgi:hypothetical protein
MRNFVANMYAEDRAGLTSMTIQSQKENLMEMRYIKMMQLTQCKYLWKLFGLSISTK